MMTDFISHKARRVGQLLKLLFAAVLLCIPMAAPVLAASDCPVGMSTLDCQALTGNWVNWEPDNAADECVDVTGDLSGKDNAQKIFNYFVSKGYTQEQAAGIAGNVSVESGFDPLIYETDDKDYTPPLPGSAGWGIVQWTPGSKVIDYANAQNFDLNSGRDQWLAIQVEFLWKQLEGKTAASEKSAGDAVKKATTVEDATTAFETLYERPADPAASIQQRITAAKQVLSLYGAASGPGSAPSGTTDTTSNCVGAASDVGQGTGKFTTNTTQTYADAQKAVARAQAIALPPGGTGRLYHQVCDKAPVGPECHDSCDYVAAEIWGYTSSGYGTAMDHWNALKNTPHGHPGDRNPPVGALLFYATGSPAGHIATYLGNNKVASNDVLDAQTGKTGGVYITDASNLEGGAWNLQYLGWADPIFGGSGGRVHIGP